MERVVLFDGSCNFCDKSVQFIIKRDPSGIFKFTSLQSDTGIGLLSKYNAPQNVDSFVLIEGNHYYLKSSAALRVCKRLNGFWKLVYLLIVIPKPVRDYFYDYFAKHRYQWFGKRQSCMLPTPEIQKRFI